MIYWYKGINTIKKVFQVESFEYCYIIIEVTNDEGGKVYKVLESVLNEIGLRTGDYKMKFTGSFHKCCEWLNTRKGIKIYDRL